MQDLACPQCHKPTIPLWNRLLLGPARSITCAECGAHVSVPYSSFWTLIPVVVGYAAAMLTDTLVDSLALFWALLAAGLLVSLWLNLKYVPLIVKA